jgi:Ca2+-binding EF-hand superfamily protein
MEEFEPYTAFLRIEKTGRRVISAACIEHMLRENNRVQFSVRDCQYLVKYFDVDGDNSLNYTEFMQMILPCDNLRLRSVASQREPRTRPINGRL